MFTSLRIFLGVALIGAAPGLLPAAPTPADCLTLADGGELPPILEWSRDVRFGAGGALYFSSRQQGVLEWQRGSFEPALWTPAGTGRNEVYLPDQLAASADRIVVSSSLFAFGFGRRQGKGLEQVRPFDEIGDLDVFGERLAILGAQRDAKGEYAPEGALAWTGRIGTDPLSWTPLFLSESGEHALNFARCGQMRVGALRFLADGSLFLVPGVEGGAYLYGPAGQLERAFAAEKLGFDTGCPLDQKAANDYGIDEEGRWAWVNRRRVVDDVLPLPDGRIGLLVRELKDGKPRFELVRVDRGGSIDRCTVPVATDHVFARLKADVRGDEIVLLLTQEGFRPIAGTATNILTGVSESLPAVLHPDQKTRFYVFRYQR